MYITERMRLHFIRVTSFRKRTRYMTCIIVRLPDYYAHNTGVTYQHPHDVSTSHTSGYTWCTTHATYSRLYLKGVPVCGTLIYVLRVRYCALFLWPTTYYCIQRKGVHGVCVRCTVHAYAYTHVRCCTVIWDTLFIKTYVINTSKLYTTAQLQYTCIPVTDVYYCFVDFMVYMTGVGIYMTYKVGYLQTEITILISFSKHVYLITQ